MSRTIIDTKGKAIIVIVFFIIAAVVLIPALTSKWTLVHDHKVIPAIITGCSKSRGRGTVSRVEATFVVNKITYTTTSQLPDCVNQHFEEFSNNVIGLTVPAVYNPEHPNINHLLILQETFDTYHVPMPDSLRWLDYLANCK